MLFQEVASYVVTTTCTEFVEFTASVNKFSFTTFVSYVSKLPKLLICKSKK